jgi:cadmium resistance protein CadD (predicted permease)
MSGGDEEPVTSPDQRKATVSGRASRIGAVLTIIILVALTFGNHLGHVQDVWLLGIAGLIALMLVIDFVLRRNGLRS